MTGEPITTLIGNLTGDPELRFTPSGSAVANFTIACTPRTFDRQSNEWKDGETLFMRCSLWREAAENAVASLTKGMRVIAEGALKSRSYETKEGEKRTVTEFEVAEIGPSLRYATAKVQRTQNNNQQGGGFGGGQQQGGQQWGGQQQGGGFQGGPQQGGFGQWGGPQQAQQPPQQQTAQQYAQAAAAGPQQGAQQQPAAAAQQGGWPQAAPAQAEDPWATPGVSNAGGWGTGQEPPF